MTGADTLIPIREAASRAIVALGNGRPGRSDRIASLLGSGRGIVQAVAAGTFVSQARTCGLSATLSMVNPNGTPPKRFATCLVELDDHPLRMRIDRDVIDRGESTVWGRDAAGIGDALARNMRILKHAPWQLTDDPHGNDPSEIVCDDGSSLTNGFRLMKDILAASGITKEGASLKVVLPTGSMPAIIEPSGFETDGIPMLIRTITPFLKPSLQIWRPGSAGSVRVSRVHARASSEGVSPMESLRATDRLIALLGSGRMHGVILR